MEIRESLSVIGTSVSEETGNRESWDQEGEMADEIKLEIWADYI